jgi:hypothetical protein
MMQGLICRCFRPGLLEKWQYVMGFDAFLGLPQDSLRFGKGLTGTDWGHPEALR